MSKVVKKKEHTSEKRSIHREHLSAEGGAIENSELIEAWNAEIEALSEREFDSFEDAADAVIEAVTTRLQIGDNEDLKEFLTNLFRDDPAVESRLRKALRIR